MLRNRPVSLVVEPESSTLPLWYSGGEFPSILSFNSIKQIIQTSDDILDSEIERAMISGETGMTFKLFCLVANTDF